MPSDYQIDVLEEEVLLHVPPPLSVLKVALSTLIGGSSLWYGILCFYLWLAKSESNWSFLYCIGYNALAAVFIASCKTLYRQLTSKVIRFERHVVGIETRWLRMKLSARWISAYAVQQWGEEPTNDADHLRIFLMVKDRKVVLADRIDPARWLNVVVQLRRKDFVYV